MTHISLGDNEFDSSDLNRMAGIVPLLAEKNRLPAIQVIDGSATYRAVQEDLEEEEAAAAASLSVYSALPDNHPAIIARTNTQYFDGFLYSSMKQDYRIIPDHATILNLTSNGQVPRLGLHFSRAGGDSITPVEVAKSFKSRLLGAREDEKKYSDEYYGGSNRNGSNAHAWYDRARSFRVLQDKATLFTCRQLYKTFEDAAAARSNDHPALANALRQAGQLFDTGTDNIEFWAQTPVSQPG